MVSCAKMSLIFEKVSSCSSFHTIVSYAHRELLRVRGFLLVWLTNFYKIHHAKKTANLFLFLWAGHIEKTLNFVGLWLDSIVGDNEPKVRD
jgi:hypothetical protein